MTDTPTNEELAERVRKGIQAEPFMLGTHSSAETALITLSARLQAAEREAARLGRLADDEGSRRMTTERELRAVLSETDYEDTRSEVLQELDRTRERLQAAERERDDWKRAVGLGPSRQRTLRIAQLTREKEELERDNAQLGDQADLQGQRVVELEEALREIEAWPHKIHTANEIVYLPHHIHEVARAALGAKERE